MKLIQSQHQSIEGNNAIDSLNVELLVKEITSTLERVSDLHSNGNTTDAEGLEEGLSVEFEQLNALDPSNALLDDNADLVAELIGA